MGKESEAIIFYDVDGTLAEPFMAPPHNLLKAIKSLDRAGIKQVLCSGKNKEYLSGLARVLGLSATSDIIAENGGVIFDWKKQNMHKVNRKSSKIAALKPKISKILKNYQYYEEPKDTIATYFIKDLSKLEEVTKQIKEVVAPYSLDVKYYKDGAIDILNDHIHKGLAVDYYLKNINPTEKVYTCGDANNDLEMLTIGTPITFQGATPEVIKLVKERNGHVADKIGPDGLLQAISELVFNKHLDAINHMDFVYRDWGSWEVLSTGKDFKVKKMVVNPGSKLSLQKHQFRSEHWFVFEGRAQIALNGKDVELSTGEDYYIPRGGIHCVANAGESELIIIEVQRGSYLGEDDIIRFK
ncbi:MAG: Alginate biosynthesis protein AlgA [bacterium ADurb.Bin212]|nr:MAG: Alginate biosynthesis protein AlgA [bacterium ADurb.Bin212]